MELIASFINEYGMSILYTVLSGLATYIGVKIKSIYQKYVDDKIKQDVVKTCVKAVEQLYKDLKGEEKYNKAVESINEILVNKGITVTDFEIKMLIESVCNDFVKAVEVKK